MSMKLMMLVNSSNDNMCEYLPNDSPQKLINEAHDLTNSVKNIPSQGCIETSQNKFIYRQYNPTKKISKEEDKLVIFICCDLNYKDNIVNKFFDKVFESLTINSYQNYKLNSGTKKNIAKLFYKYQYINSIDIEIKNWKDYSLEFGTLREITNFDIDTKRTNQSISIYGILDSIDEKDMTKYNKGTNGEIRIPIEASRIKKWKNLKCVFLFINFILLTAVIILFLSIMYGHKFE